MPRGRLPTGMVATTLSAAASMTVTLFERSFGPYTRGSAPARAATGPSAASESSATPTQPNTIALPPSRREPAPAIRHRRAERIEIFPAHVGHQREWAEGPADVLALARPDHVQRLPELVIPLAKREGFALVAVEGRRRLQERDESGAVAGAGAHHGLADQLERGPRGPRGLAERRAPLAPEAAVQLAGAEALQLVVPADRPEPRRALGGEAQSGLANPSDPVGLASLGDCPRHQGIDAGVVHGQQQNVGAGRVADHGAA